MENAVFEPAENSAKTGHSLTKGVEVIRQYVKTLPDSPGVYRMLALDLGVLYVGKARRLKHRVAAYTRPDQLPMRLRRMIAATHSMEFIVCASELEALLLEANLIKKLKPRYNILLNDDKSFPFIFISDGHDFPAIGKHRGKREQIGSYYGPFASGGAVNQTIIDLTRGFMLRNCSDSFFAQRSRPCLQYHIKRCTAPCVDKISAAAYAQQVAEAKAFLSGQSRHIQQKLVAEMQTASENMAYEQAAILRDRIKALTAIQAHQSVYLSSAEDADVLALAQKGGRSCIQVFFFRGGVNYGNRSFFPSHDADAKPESILSAFMIQFYANHAVPPVLILDRVPAEEKLLTQALSHIAKGKIQIVMPHRGERRKLVEIAHENAEQALARKLAEQGSHRQMLAELAEIFNLPAPPQRIEIYDNSHFQSSFAIGAMVVADGEGLRKNAYRKFTIKDSGAAGDDYAMMREVFRRRFLRAKSPSDSPDESHAWPDLVLIDGGIGQLHAAEKALADIEVKGIHLVAIAKGPDRNAGRERFFMPNRAPFQLPENTPVLHFLQRLRDEAHRYAIGTHRDKRAKSISTNGLEDIPGIGAARKKALLHHFGSAKAVKAAGIEDLTAVSGISAAMAKKIHSIFHQE